MMLIVVGLLLVTGLWDQWVGDLRGLVPRLRGPAYETVTDRPRPRPAGPRRSRRSRRRPRRR